MGVGMEQLVQLKVSVIIPVYNVERFLRRCIESVQNQGHVNLEIILVDDGSTDASGMICDACAEKDCRIKVIHKQNNGVSAARNSGMDIATGEYICFVDGDDYVMPDYVEYLLHLSIVHHTRISISTEVYTSFDLKQCRDTTELIYTGEQATEAILCYKLQIGVYNKLFERSFLKEKNVRFIEGLPIGEGFNFNVAAFQRADHIAVGHRKVYFYRKDNSDSVTTKFNAEKWKAGLYALHRIKEDFIIHSGRIERAWDFAWWRTNSDVYDLLVLADVSKEYPDMYRGCREVMKKNAFSCFKVPTSGKNRLRAVVMSVCPGLVPAAMKLRKWKYHVKVTHK